MNFIKFKKLHKLAFAPSKTNPTDSGFDLYSDQNTYIAPNETVVIKTGIQIALPSGYEAQIRPRSGVSAKTPLIVMLGTIDNGYRGEIGIIVKNVGVVAHAINVGDRIAQLVPVKIDEFFVEEVEDLDYNTQRGVDGFGSTGV